MSINIVVPLRIVFIFSSFLLVFGGKLFLFSTNQAYCKELTIGVNIHRCATKDVLFSFFFFVLVFFGSKFICFSLHPVQVVFFIYKTMHARPVPGGCFRIVFVHPIPDTYYRNRLRVKRFFFVCCVRARTVCELEQVPESNNGLRRAY